MIPQLQGYFSGPNSIFNRSIEITKDYWDTVIEVPGVELINNAYEKYITIVAAKEWNKTEPMDDKFLHL